MVQIQCYFRRAESSELEGIGRERQVHRCSQGYGPGEREEDQPEPSDDASTMQLWSNDLEYKADVKIKASEREVWCEPI